MAEGRGTSHWDQCRRQFIQEVNSGESPGTPGAKAWQQR